MLNESVDRESKRQKDAQGIIGQLNDVLSRLEGQGGILKKIGNDLYAPLPPVEYPYLSKIEEQIETSGFASAIRHCISRINTQIDYNNESIERIRQFV